MRKPEKLKFRWSDLDPNGHVRNSAYCDTFVDARMQLFKKAGFPISKLTRLNLGPIVLREDFYYIKEVFGDAEVYVTIYIAGKTEDNRYFKFVQHLYSTDGTLCAYLEFTFGLLDLSLRKMAVPPSDLLEYFLNLEHTEHYAIIDKSTLKNHRIPYGKILNINDV